MKEIVVACTRRAIIYPLVRSWHMVTFCWSTVEKILKHSKRAVINILIRIHDLLAENEQYSMFNEIVVDDYIGWVQGPQCSEQVLKGLAKELSANYGQRKDIPLGLDLLEEAT